MCHISGVHVCVLWWNLKSVQNEEEIMIARISETAGAIFVCRLPYLAGTSVATLVLIG